MLKSIVLKSHMSQPFCLSIWRPQNLKSAIILLLAYYYIGQKKLSINDYKFGSRLRDVPRSSSVKEFGSVYCEVLPTEVAQL